MVWTRPVRLGLVFTLMATSLAALVFAPRMPLGLGYHDFADKRTLLDVPNCLDVLSNVPFFVVGVWGILWLLRGSSDRSFIEQPERIPYLLFFTGVALTGIGSFWYHLNPGNTRLPWDLLPMTVSFISMVAATIIERISFKTGFLLYVPLLALGAASVGYWYLTEAHGHGDYRFYLYVQFFSPLLLAITIFLFPPRYTGVEYLVFAFVLFVMAKLMETFDWQIYGLGGVVSGHALKHATAGAACYCVLLMLQNRRPFAISGPARFARAERIEPAPDHFRP